MKNVSTSVGGGDEPPYSYEGKFQVHKSPQSAISSIGDGEFMMYMNYTPNNNVHLRDLHVYATPSELKRIKEECI